MFSGDIPFCDDENEMRVTLKVMRGHRPAPPFHDLSITRGLSDVVWNLIETCWNSDWAKRPTTTHVIEQFHALPNLSTDERPVDDLKIDLPPQILYNHSEHPFYTIPTTAQNMLEPHHLTLDFPTSRSSAYLYSLSTTGHEKSKERAMWPPSTTESSKFKSREDEDDNSTQNDYPVSRLDDSEGNTFTPNSPRRHHYADAIQTERSCKGTQSWPSRIDTPSIQTSWNNNVTTMPDIQPSEFNGNKRKRTSIYHTDADAEFTLEVDDVHADALPVAKRRQPSTMQGRIKGQSGAGSRNIEREYLVLHSDVEYPSNTSSIDSHDAKLSTVHHSSHDHQRKTYRHVCRLNIVVLNADRFW